ncbi:hypothetical protein B0H12DRAFT_1245166 [Mycena haematopus]|nr:hypothetical protein B0H12DRAFT_1245166 [Mycena haematopus]
MAPFLYRSQCSIPDFPPDDVLITQGILRQLSPRGTVTTTRSNRANRPDAESSAHSFALFHGSPRHSSELPVDVALFLTNIGSLSTREYEGLPCAENIHLCPIFSQRQDSEIGSAYDAAMKKAPHLEFFFPAPTLPCETHIDDNSSDEDVDGKARPRPPAKKTKTGSSISAPLVVPDSDHHSEEDESRLPSSPSAARYQNSRQENAHQGRAKHAGHDLRARSRVSYGDDEESEEEKPKTSRSAKKGKKVVLSSEERVAELLPQIRSALLEMVSKRRRRNISVRTVQGSVDSPYLVTLVHKTGNAIYRGRNNLGPGDDDEHKELPRLDFEPRLLLPVEQAIMPNGPCSLCILYEVTCYPNGIGMGCVHCILKKAGHLCDHSSNAGRFQHIVAQLQDVTGDFAPHGSRGFGHELLRKVASRARVTQDLARRDREEFAALLRKFLTVAHSLNIKLGTDGLQSLYAESTRPVLRQSFNYMIDWFNKSLDPTLPDPVMEELEDLGNVDDDSDGDQGAQGDDDVQMGDAGGSGGQ